MFAKLVVPVDLTATSFDAVPMAASMAEQVDGTVDVVTVVDRLADVPPARQALTAALEQFAPGTTAIRPEVLADRSVSRALTRHIEAHPGSMLMLRSHGQGRSAGVVGGTVDEMLRAMFGPIIVVGPRAVAGPRPLGGTYVVPIDGSDRAIGVLPIVGAWTIEFGGTPWLVEVVENGDETGSAVQSSYVRDQAVQLEQRIGKRIESQVLHDTRVAQPIVDFAAERGASLIFMATHGRTGVERLRMGSVAADVVRHAPMPVVLFRPPSSPVRHEPTPRFHVTMSEPHQAIRP